EFEASDGRHAVSTTVRVDVRSAVGARSAPRFLSPTGDGTALNLVHAVCVELPIVVVDEDSRSVDVVEEAPRIAGATLQRMGPFEFRWRWCPSAMQLSASDRYVLHLSASDGENPKVLFAYLIVIRRPTTFAPLPGVPSQTLLPPDQSQTTPGSQGAE